MPSDFIVPAQEIKVRISLFQKRLGESGLDAGFILQRVDLFYFTGTAQNAFLYVPVAGEPLLLVKKYFPRARAESPLKNLVAIKSVKEIPGLIKKHYGKLSKTLGLELDVMPVSEFHFYQKLFPKQIIRDCSALIFEMRAIKNSWETTQLEKAADLSCQTFEYLRTVIRPGMSVMELGTMLETFGRQHDHSGKLRVRDFRIEAYPWQITGGISSGAAGQKLLQSNQPILVELATMLNGYHISESRMVVMGDLSGKAQSASQAVIQIHDAVLEKIKPGMNLHTVLAFAKAEAERLRYGDVFLGPIGNKSKFVGHSIGTELIEPPFLSEKEQELLQTGMALTLEPNLVFKDEFTTGIASTFQVTKTGTRLLSKTPVEIIAC